MVVMVLHSEFQKTEVGRIPKDWDVQNIGDAFEICNTLRFPISRLNRKKISGIYPYYGPTGIQDYISEYRVDGEYALIGEDGDHFLKWRKKPMTILVSGKFNVNNHAHLVKGTKNLTKWFYWYFIHRDVSQYLTKQGAGRLKLTKKVLSKIPCAIPSPSEQLIISNVLYDANEVIHSLENLIEKKKNIKQGTMLELLSGEKRLEGFNEKWEEKTLKDIVEIPISDGPHETPKFLHDGIPFLSVNNIENNQIDLSSLRYISTEDHIRFSKKCKPQKGDILLGKAASVGHVAIIDFLFEFNIWSPLALIRINNNNIAKFIYYYIQTKHIKNQIIFLTHSSSQGNLGMGEMEKLEFLLPLKKEQSSIAQILSDMDSEIYELEKKRDKYIMVKNGIMQKLLTGEIRLK
jgi:type I restriction enzyme, S subunit